MATIKRPGAEAAVVKGWLGSRKWLLARRVSQLGILALFLLGPLAGIWIVKGNLTFSYTLGVLPLTLADASSLVATSPVGRVLTDPLDRVPVVELVHRLAALVEEHDCVRSVAADPVVVSPMWARVADVEIRVGEPVEEFAVRRLE